MITMTIFAHQADVELRETILKVDKKHHIKVEAYKTYVICASMNVSGLGSLKTRITRM